MMKNSHAILNRAFFLALAMMGTTLAFGQSSEYDDPAVGEDKAYFIDGDSVTFSGNPELIQLEVLGKWSTLQGLSKSLDLDFTDIRTVIAGYEDGTRQFKGTWTISGNVIQCSFQTRDSKYPTEIEANLKSAGIEVAGFGVLTKNN